MIYTNSFYVYLDAGWTDITSYVKTEYGVNASNIGISSSRWNDRIAGIGQINFYVDNTDGLFDPALATCLAGWKRGAKFKHTVTFESVEYIKFYGYIDTIQLNDPSVYFHNAHVTVKNFMKFIYNYPVVTPAFQSYQTGDVGINSILSEITQTAQNIDLDTGDNVFNALFDTVTNSTTASTEINKIVQSEFGYFYCQNDPIYGETIRFEKYSHRNGLAQLATIPKVEDQCDTLTDESGNTLTDESGNILLMDESEDAVISSDVDSYSRNYGQNVTNRVRVVAYPKYVGASSVTLYTLQQPTAVGSMQSITFRGKYTDPSSGTEVNAVSSSCARTFTANTASNGSGTNLTASFTVVATYGTESPSFVVTNNSAYAGYLTQLGVTGYIIKAYDTAESIFEDSPSQTINGIETLSLDQLYQNSVTFAEAIGQYVLEIDKNPRVDMESISLYVKKSSKNMMAFLNLNVGDLIQITENTLNENALYWIQSVNYSIDAGGNIMFKFTLKKFWSLLLGLSLISCTFHAASTDALCYGNLTQLIDLPQMTMSAWVNPTTLTKETVMSGWVSGVGGIAVYVGGSAYVDAGAIQVVRIYSSAGGQWVTTEKLTANHTSLVTVAINNDGALPDIYINGVKATTSILKVPAIGYDGTPVGYVTSINGMDWCVGNIHGQASDTNFALPFIGTIKDARVYNRILTGAEVATLYSEGAGGSSVTDGLVFQSPTVKTEDASYYNGHTLISTDRVIDNIFGAIGKTNGSPTTALP